MDKGTSTVYADFFLQELLAMHSAPDRHSSAFALPTSEANRLKRQLDNTLSLLRDEPFEPMNTLDLRVALHAVIDSLRLP